MNAAVTAVLELEQAIVDWSADTEDGRHRGAPGHAAAEGNAIGRARRGGCAGPAGIVAPFVEALLELRERAREEGAWTLADTLRDRLTAAGIEVRDTTLGVTWLLAGSPDTG